MKKLFNQKIATLVTKLKAIDEKIEVLNSYREYPYKAGHMVCTNRYTDNWEPTKKHKSMLETQYSAYAKLDDQIGEIVKRLTDDKQKAYQILTDSGYCTDQASEAVADWYMSEDDL